MKIVAIQEFRNTKEKPLLPLIAEPIKLKGKECLTQIEISAVPGNANAAKVKLSVRILEGHSESPREVIAWCKQLD